MNLQDYISFVSWINNTKWAIIGICLFSAIFALTQPNMKMQKTNYTFFAFALAAFAIFRIGCLPIGWGFSADRERYAANFLGVKYGGYSFSLDNSDPFWNIITSLIAPFGDSEFYFIAQSSIYIALYFFACQRLSGNNTFWLLACLTSSMGFISYGTNTMRAGMAIAFIVLGLTYWKRQAVMYTLFAMALLTHFSMLLPILMIVICRYYNNTRLCFYIWFLALIVSLAAGNFFNEFFSTFIEDERTDYLTRQNAAYKQGFRWDFVVYSLIPIIIGAYYIFKKGFKDKLYWLFYNAYVLTNSFWVLVIRANFTDRFAYLSWFMIPFILAYPLLRPDAPVKRPNQWLAVILLGEAAFNMIM